MVSTLRVWGVRNISQSYKQRYTYFRESLIVYSIAI